MATIAELKAPPVFEWKRWPKTDEFLDEVVAAALSGNALAEELAGRMPRETGTQFKVWIDHLVLAGDRALAERLARLGYERQASTFAVGVPLYVQSGGIFPPIALVRGTSQALDGTQFQVKEVAIKVESVPAFSRAHDLGLEIAGYAMGPYRVARVAGERTSLAVVERRGYRGFEPYPGELAREGRMQPHAARDALAARDLWEGRRRRFDDDETGIAATEETLERVIELAGSTDLACHLVFWKQSDRTGSLATPPRGCKRPDRIGWAWDGPTMIITLSAARDDSFRES